MAKPRFLAVYDASDADKDAARFVELECSSHKAVVEGCDVSVGNLKLRTEGRDRDRLAREWADAIESTIGRRRTSAFAPQRSRSRAAFFVSGAEYFGAVKNAIDQATTSVCVAGWRIEPQTPLQRNPTVSVVDVLGNAVKRGVRVCVLLHREISATMQPRHRSGECAEILEKVGVEVLRHPRPMARQAFWTHHEKVVVVDQQRAFVGGLDLCEGRYDDLERRLRDDTLVGRESTSPAPRIPWILIGHKYHACLGTTSRVPSTAAPR